ncbi:hypothetical protein [Pedobacter psychrodurus]|uniref:hypothetical protein n=1 Tax=Pedobacter psychrodurus TaxID=2530456 RepID=UPI00292D1258|nr:hypothetical protein [Pedobacter psychrodurus]
MSAHDSHAPVQQTTGIWALPLTAWILVLLLCVYFTRPIFNHKEASAHHEKTEAAHEKPEAHH